MKKILLGSLALLTLASCSKDETTAVNRDGDQIEFSAVANKSTRAADVYCNNNLPAAFNVWAAYEGKTYIDGDLIAQNGSKWENQSGTRYWPNEGDVDFYAHVNAGDNFQWSAAAAPKIEQFKVDPAAEVSAHVDLLYAVKTGQNKAANSEKVALNFRHALSQIVFRAKNTNANLYVEISGVKICKLGDTNTFTFPTESTDDNIVNHEGTTGNIIYGTNWGTWDELNGGASTYGVSLGEAKPVSLADGVVSLTDTNIDGKEYSSSAMLLLPQTTTAWNVEEPETGVPANQDGTYFLVKCQIWNVAGNEVDKDNDVCLWGKEGAADVAIPVAFNWEQGKKYIYTFCFGKGNGGYDPDPEDPEDPTPVLVPITFDVTVDDFVPVENVDLETGL